MIKWFSPEVGKDDLRYVEKAILNNYINEFNSIKLIYSKNNLYYYLFDKGINTIAHIFKILLINTKNVKLVNYYCIKSIHYYIEFIEQNNRQADDKIRYTHASLFSYGNTIYKLNKSYRKTAMNIADETVAYIIHTNEEQELVILKNVEIMIDLYNTQITGAQNHSTTLMTTLMTKLIELYPDDVYDVNFELEHVLAHKLNFVVDFIALTNISSISILLTHVREKNTITLNKPILLKKILHRDETHKNEEEYIKWLLLY